MKINLKLVYKGIGQLFIVGCICVLLANFQIISNTSSRLHDDYNTVTNCDVALVLGTSKMMASGYINQYFKHRMDAAFKLYKHHKVKHFLLSGDNSIVGYDEPQDMKDYLVNLGVPASCITLDYAGFRTFDSVIRAKRVFGQSNLIVVSQKQHNQRALFLCDHFDIEAEAFNAKNPRNSIRQQVREVMAKSKAVLDAYFLFTQPKFLGEEVKILV